MLHLPDNIKYIRELANKTQDDFAEMFDIKDKKGKFSKDKIYTYESGRAKPPSYFLEALAEFAGVTVAALKTIKLNREAISFKQQPDLVTISDGQARIFEVKPDNDKDAKIASLEFENISLRLKAIEVNLKECLSNQQVLMRQVSVAMHLAAERYAGPDKKKLQEEVYKIGKLISAVNE